MRPKTARYISFLAGFALLVLPVFALQAANFQAGEQVSVTADETVEEDVYAAGGMINMTGSVLGDIFTAAGNVMIDSDVSEDLQAVGGTVNALGDVSGDLRIAGGVVTVTGSIEENAVIAGGQTQVSGEQIGGNLFWAGETLTLTSSVAGDITLRGKEARINADIDGDVAFRGDKLILEEGTTIDGDVSYTSPEEAEIKDGVTIAGSVDYEQTETAPASPKEATFAFASVAALIWLLVRTVGALVVGLSLPQFTNDVVTTSFTRPWAELGRGLVTLVVAPIVAVMLLVSVAGIPFGLMTLLLYGTLMIVASLLAPVLLGSLMRRWIKQTEGYDTSWLTILLGVVLFALLGFIPVVGWLVQFVFVLFTIGAVVNIIWKHLNTYSD